ncbi:unnamed protein product, partial [Urochloa humidicola]
ASTRGASSRAPPAPPPLAPPHRRSRIWPGRRRCGPSAQGRTTSLCHGTLSRRHGGCRGCGSEVMQWSTLGAVEAVSDSDLARHPQQRRAAVTAAGDEVRSPNVVARLMGLDEPGTPPVPPPFHPALGGALVCVGGEILRDAEAR